MTKEKFGSRLKKARIARNMTQFEVQKSCGVPEETISRLEQGTRWPSIDTLTALSRSLGVSCDYLLGMTNSMTPVRRLWHSDGLAMEDISLITEFIDMIRSRRNRNVH